MSYIDKKTMTNLLIAGLLIVVGYCLQWAGLATLTSRITSAMQLLQLVNYEWSLRSAVMIQLVYLGDIWWWDTVAHVFTAWAVGGIVVVAGLYKFLSIRLAALATIALLVGTFTLSAPTTFSTQLITSAGGKVHDEAKIPGAEKSATDYDTPAIPTISDFWSGNDVSLPLGYAAYGFAWSAKVYNLVRLALIPFITISLTILLIASLRRSRA